MKHFRSICGRRVRVELSNAGSRKGAYRGGPPRRGRPFHPEDKCYECGDRGHYARDCRRFKGGRRRYIQFAFSCAIIIYFIIYGFTYLITFFCFLFFMVKPFIVCK